MTLMSEHPVYIRTFGDKNKQPLVLLHGWGMSGDVFEPLVADLAEGFYLIIPDLPGLGRSEETVLSSPLRLVDVAKQLMLTLEPLLQSPAVLVGWSLGGNLATQIAVDYGACVSSVILVASNPCFVVRDDWTQAMPVDVYDAFKASVDTQQQKALTRFSMLQVQGDPHAKDQLKFIKSLLSELTPVQLPEMLRLLEGDYRDLLQGVKQPVLHILGGVDQLIPVSMADELSATYPDHQMCVIREAAHLPFLTSPVEFKHLIESRSSQVVEVGNNDSCH